MSHETRTCRKCGVVLTPDNAYSRIREAFVPQSYCMACQKERERARYNSDPKTKIKRVLSNYEKKKKYTTKVRRGKVEFPSFQAKHDFLAMRRIQARFGRGHISCSSNINKAVYVPRYEEIEQDNETIILKHYEPLKCEECGGLVLYKDNNYQVCSDCGLIANDRLNIINIEPFPQANKLSGPFRYSIPITETEPLGDSSENIRCYDRYYARAYSKRLR